MVKRFSSRDARANFSELLGMVYYTKEPVIVERKGKPYAVLISPEQYAAFVDQQEQAWHIIDQMRAGNADEDPEAVLADVTAEVDAVRRERHDEQRRSGQRGR